MNRQGCIDLCFLGDVYMDGVAWSADDVVRAAAAKADVVIANLESPLTDRGTPDPEKPIHLRNHPDNVRFLQSLSVRIVSLANNHMCDFGLEGLRQTRQVLASRSILPAGAGENRAEATRPVVVQVNGLRLGVLAFCAAGIQARPAGEAEYGVAILQPAEMLEATRRLRQQADVVVLQPHWGLTNYRYPLPDHVALARKLLEEGASLVVCHHPHVIQGWERHGPGAIVHSLGDFAFAPYRAEGKPTRFSRENRRAMMAAARVTAEGVQELDFLMTHQQPTPFAVRALSPRKALRRKKVLQKLSRPIRASRYEKFFKNYLRRHLVCRTLRWLDPRLWPTFRWGYVKAGLLIVKRIVKAGK